MPEKFREQAYRSQMPQLEWPAMPSTSAAYTLALLLQIEDSQWWTPEELLQHQLRQLGAMLAHAYQQVPLYRKRLDQAGYRPGESVSEESFRCIPTLTRQEVLDYGTQLDAASFPKEHGGTHTIRTSGSTGQPVVIKRTAIALRLLYAISIRSHRWHNHDFSARIATIRHFRDKPPQPPDGIRLPNWGDPVSPLFHTGDAWCLDTRSNASEQLDWLLKVNPGYLVTAPSVAESAAELSLRRGVHPTNLQQVRTMGETVSDTLRDTVRRAWGVEVADTYSSNEVGHIAIQIPGSERYFVPQEHVYVELLDAEGRPVASGETGRVVVTPLLNFATPLIRYEMGDYAELGQASDCGRGLAVLNRIYGRTRNMLVLPDGDKRFASFGIKTFNAEHGDRIREYQIIQRRIDSLELTLAMDTPFTPEEEAALLEWITQWVKYRFHYDVRYVQSIPRSAAGKFEVFRSEISPGAIDIS